MGTVVGIIQGQKFVDQFLRLLKAQTVIAFDRRLAGHGCNLFLNDLKTSAIAGLLGQFIQHCQEQFPLTASVEIHWHTTEGIFVASESINLKSQLCKSILIGVQNAFLLPCQADNNRRHQTLGHHTLFIKLFHQAFIFYLFMSRMLVNDEQFVFKLDQPVSIKDLTDNPVTAAILHGQQFFLEQIQLLGIFDLRFRGGSCILRRCRGLSGSSCCGHLFLYRVLPVFRRHCLREEIIFLRYGCGADCFGNFWCITVQDGLRFFHRHSSCNTHCGVLY